MTRRAPLLALPLLAALACGGSSGPSGPGPGPVPGIGPAGGTASLGTEAIVRVPPGALSTPVEITVSSAALPAALQAAGGFAPAYRFEPSGQAFATPVEIEIFVPDGSLGGRDPATLRLVSTGGAGGVETLGGLRRTVVQGGVRVIGTTTHFSTIAPAEPPNADPTVDAGPDRDAAVGTSVALQATTTDADGDPVSVTWAFDARPAGSAAALTSASGPSTGFTPDVAGEYRVRATASDGRGGTASDVVVVTVTEVVADAGPDRTAETGSTVTLDGSGSIGQGLGFAWRIVSTPGGSTPTLQNASQAMASFVPNQVGDYLVELTVSNGSGSDRDTVRVTVVQANRAPTVSLSGPVAVFAGDPAALVATASDPDGDALAFEWEVVVSPSGTASVSSQGPTATLVANDVGTYLVRVTVSDGKATAQAEYAFSGNARVAGTYSGTFTIEAATGCGDPSPAGQTATGDLPILQPAPETVVIDLPALDPLFGSTIDGTLQGMFFSFDGTITLRGIDGNGDPTTVNLAGTVRGTMDGSSLDLTFEGGLFGCQVTASIVGPIQ